ncbi:unknown [Crocosphaera subtropica ATCC 51142]|uniref:Sulfatase-modifying factor enzyme-like domain-containing protein n=1 Tax=Crocosphaera subtropica (strain ATCC 51142 / BH68) TaxID=43989 RepID=B1WNE8_CROS5|nr:SUMF1/EgtB/PvdO family nonheme iron enzyme [Crocosphaera subtropica]ACB49790.1 unknown [Crocosphaera subtropica ATCC 51142]
MSNIQVSVRIPPKLYEKLLAHTNAVGLPKSKVITQALSQYLETDEKEKPSSSIEERLVNVEKRLERLESSPTLDKSSNVIQTKEKEKKSQPTLSFKTPPLQEFFFERPIIDETGTILKRLKGESQCFKEELGDGIILEMIYIPGGTFVMGSTSDEPGSQVCEQPQHTVTLEGFFLGKFPITQKQWEIVAQYPKVNRDLGVDPSCFKGSDRPVESLSWEDAVEFCDRLSQYTQRPYQLPSEAQWEYACRGETTSPFYFGPTLTGDLANYMAKRLYAGESSSLYRQETTSVSAFYPNGFGLYDLHGNVWEWCADAWYSSYDNASTSGKPRSSSQQETRRVLRGGSWDEDAYHCRCASRYAYHPQAVGVSQIGFRVMLMASGQ